MSDLSQLFIDQQNKVGLYVDTVKANNVFLPSTFSNINPNKEQQPMIIGIDSYNTDSTQITTSLYQKPFCSVQGDDTPQIITAGGTYQITFQNQVIIEKNVGIFSGGTLELPISGYYRFTYSVSKSWAAGNTESVCSFFVSVNANIGGNVQGVKSLLSSAAAGQGVVSDSFIALINGQPNKIVFGIFTDVTGTIALTYPTLTAELISPYTA
jgi:hypothetical protein